MVNGDVREIVVEPAVAFPVVSPAVGGLIVNPVVAFPVDGPDAGGLGMESAVTFPVGPAVGGLVVESGVDFSVVNPAVDGLIVKPVMAFPVVGPDLGLSVVPSILTVVEEAAAIKYLMFFKASSASATVAFTDVDTALSSFFTAKRAFFSAGVHLTLVGVSARPVAKAKTLAISLLAAAGVRRLILARTSAHDVEGSWSSLASLLAVRRYVTFFSTSTSWVMALSPLSTFASASAF